MPNKEFFPSKPCTIETIDTGFVEHLQNEFNIHVFTNSGFRKVPVIWVGAERAFQTKADASLRDTAGKLILPIMTVQRTGMQKDPSFKGAVQADIIPESTGPRAYLGGAFRIAMKTNQKKTSQLQNAHNLSKRGPNQAFGEKSLQRIVFDEYLVPVPVYMAITYSITLRCEYQQQMNQMVLPFITTPGQVNYFVVKKDGHRFESFIQQEFSANNNLSNMSEEERKFETKIDVKVLGYLIGSGPNEERPKIVRRETVATLLTPIESIRSPPVQGTARTDKFRDLPLYKTKDGKCYIKKRIVGLSEEDKTAHEGSTGDVDGAFVNSETTSITDLIDNVRKGNETRVRLGETILGVTPEDTYSETDDEDCD